jgi:hypothetical protein
MGEKTHFSENNFRTLHGRTERERFLPQMHTDLHGWNWADFFSNQQAAIGMIARWTVCFTDRRRSFAADPGRATFLSPGTAGFPNQPGPTEKSAIRQSPSRLFSAHLPFSASPRLRLQSVFDP